MEVEGSLKCGRAKLRMNLIEGVTDFEGVVAQWNAKTECPRTIDTHLDVDLKMGKELLEGGAVASAEILSIGANAVTEGWILADGIPLCPDCVGDGLTLGVLKLCGDDAEDFN